MATKKTATKKSATKKSGSTTGKLGIAAALAGAAAAGFYLYGPRGAENRVKVRAWTLKAKAEVLEHFERAKEVTEDSYAEVVDKVTNKYAKQRSVGELDATKLNAELKKHWKAIVKAVEPQEKKKK